MAIEFEGQRPEEKVAFVFRRHILTSWRGFVWLVIVCGLSVLPMMVWGSGMLPVMLGGFILGLMGLMYAYMLWFFSVYVVTNERVRQINQKGMFKKTVIDVDLNKIQSASYKTPGLFGGILGYGTILIQTMVGDMTISMVRKPAEVYNQLQTEMVKANNRGEK